MYAEKLQYGRVALELLGAVDGIVAAGVDVNDVADCAAAVVLQGHGIAGIEVEGVPHQQCDAGALHGSNHVVGIGNVDGQRLLQQDVFAGFRRRNHGVAVIPVGQADADRVNVIAS